MQRIVFYSWQSDLPNSTNRGFIQEALEEAARAITADDSVEVEPVVDRDTQGASGSPDIASTIFAKITASDVFVADVSIIIKPGSGSKVSPNPNVLLELGYAYKALGHERVILVFNTAFGDIKDLPFDLRTRRVVPYRVSKDTARKSEERSRLQSVLDAHIRAALKHTPEPESKPSLISISAIENVHPGRVIIVRRELTDIMNRIIALAPINYAAGGRMSEMEGALTKNQEVVAEFAKIVDATAILRDETIALEILKSFHLLFQKYNHPHDYSGPISNADHDYYRFVGWELMLTFVALLIREQAWDILAQILSEPIQLDHLPRSGEPGNLYWDFAQQSLYLFADASRERQRKSLAADIIKSRHDDAGGLGKIVSFEKIMDADLFLYMRAHTSVDQRPFVRWLPWTHIYNNTVPVYLINSAHRATAAKISRALNAGSVEEMKTKLEALSVQYGQHYHDFWRNPLDIEVVKRIGQEGGAAVVKTI